MAITAYPLNLDEYIGAETVQLWHYGRTTGVFSADDNLRVSAYQNMRIQVSTGVAWLKYGAYNGIVVVNPELMYINVPIADGVLNRIDRIVMYFDIANNITDIKLKQGTYASNPIPPTLERSAEWYEIVLAEIRVNAGIISITAEHITDTRLDELICGIVRDGVNGIPTQALYDTFIAWFNNLKETGQKEFIEWFTTIKDILDENTAGNLLNLINALTAKVNDLEELTSILSNEIMGVRTNLLYALGDEFSTNTSTITSTAEIASLQTQLNKKIVVSETEPADASEGDVWYQENNNETVE